MTENYRRDRVEEILGKEIPEEFRGILALIHLVDYRMVDAVDDCNFACRSMFRFDTLMGKKASTRAIAAVLSPVIWCLSKIKNRKVPKADPRLVFSSTFLLSARYPAAREVIEKDTGCTAVLTFTDMLKLEGKNQQLNLKASLKPEKHARKPVYFPGQTVAGGKLAKAVVNYCETVYGAHSTKDPETIRAALRTLEAAYQARVRKIEKCLRKDRDCALYMTINQYNLRDLLIIHACKNLGIRTMEQGHFAAQFSWMPYSEENKMDRLCFAGEYGFWNEMEKRFQERVYACASPLYKPEELRFFISGNPEISREQAEMLRARYKPERKLTFMLFAHQNRELVGIEDKYVAWRWGVFKALKELKEKQNLIINVRYTPYKEMEYREKEEPTLKEWGFTVSESVPSNLMEDLLTSVAIMSSTSSVMSTARLFGKLVYRVENYLYPYVHVDDNIHEVKISEIPDIVIPEGIEETLPEIDFDGIFDVNRIK